jgi:hypothetical protein
MACSLNLQNRNNLGAIFGICVNFPFRVITRRPAGTSARDDHTEFFNR